MKDTNKSENQKISNLHPTDEILSNFIDNKLLIADRDIVLKHLIYCNDCSDIVAIVIKNIKKKH